jgi:hypothetical protein
LVNDVSIPKIELINGIIKAKLNNSKTMLIITKNKIKIILDV